jgi:hypothetical protein
MWVIAIIHGPNWKVAYDGYLEGYHFKAAHPETIEPRTFTNVMEYDAHGPHQLVGFAAKNVTSLEEVDRDDLWQHETKGFDFIRLFFPNVSIFIAPEITQIAQMIPGPGPMENTTICIFAPVAARERRGLCRRESRWRIGCATWCRTRTTTSACSCRKASKPD